MRNFILFLCLSLTTVLYSQVNQAEVDSLRHIIAQTKRDTNEVNSLLELSRKLSQKDFAEAKDLANQAIELSDSLNWPKGTAFGYKHLGFVYGNNVKLDEAMTAFQTSKAKFEAMNDRKGIASLLNEIGVIYYYKSDYEQSIENFNKAANLEFELNNLERSSGILLNIANIHKSRSNLPMALEFFERALDMQSSLKSGDMKTTILINMGLLYSDLNNNKKAIQILERALKICEATDILDLKGTIYVNLSSSYSEEGDIDKALPYANKALALFRELDYHRGIPLVLSLIGNIRHEKNDYLEALANYEEAYTILKEQQNNNDLSELLSNLSSLSYDMGNYQNALSQAKESLKLSRESKNLESEQAALFSLQQCYAKLGNNNAAYQNLLAFIDVKDSLFNEEKLREVNQVEMKYAINREKLADSLVFDQKKIVLETEVQQAKQDKWFLFGIAGLLVLLATILYRNNQRRRQTNELLSKQKAEIETKSHQNEVLLKEIHHRVKNNLQTISSLLFLQSAHIQDVDIKKAVAAGQHRVESIALIHQKLYQRENLAAIEMKDYLTNLGQTLIDTFAEQPEKIKLNVEMAELEMDVDTAVPLGLIANELINNTLKYAFPKDQSGEITIQMTKSADEKIELFIADNGVGSSNTKSGTAFGTQLIDLLAVQLNGTVKSGNENGYWTRLSL